MQRRSFMAAVLAAAAAPAIARAGSLMPVKAISPGGILLPVLHGDGIGDDWAALQALLKGEQAVDLHGSPIAVSGGVVRLAPGTYRATSALWFERGGVVLMGPAGEGRAVIEMTRSPVSADCF